MKMKTMLFVCMAVFAGNAFASITAGSNYVVETFYANPHDRETMAAFDWDNESNLYYLTGRPDWGLGLSFYRYDGAVVSNLYTDTDAFSGGRVTAIGGRIYFKDFGTYERLTSDYYMYDPAQPAEPVNIGVESDLYGLATRDGTDFWAAGGWSAAIHYSKLDTNGNLVSNPLVNLGVIGEASGPIVFDTNGNLYYSEGYVEEGTPTVYRWTAAEVSAAIADPDGAPLTPSNHIWATLSSGSGASGMAFDDNGNLLVTATSFIEPSELQRLFVTNGVYSGYEVLASSDERLETVRVRDGEIYFNSPEGIFTVEPGQVDQSPVNDYNGDGKSDMAVYASAGGKWYIRGMNGDSLIFDQQWGGSGFIPVSGDFTGDGKSDLAVYHESSGNWYVRTVDGATPVFGEQWGGPGLIPVSGDYNGDGKSDMAVYDPVAGKWYIRGANGESLIFDEQWGGSGFAPVSGDFTGDGRSDLAVYHESSGNWYVRTVDGANPVFGEQWGGPGLIPVPGDYNGDGKSDMAVYDAADGKWYIRGANGESLIFGEQWGGSGFIPVAGDFTGDGKSDLAVYHKSTGNWYVRTVDGATLVFGEQWGGPGMNPVQ